MKKRLVFTLLFFILVFSIWEMVSTHLVEYRFVLPSPSSILFRIWQNPYLFITNSKTTLREMAGGFLLALFISFPIAWSMYRWKGFNGIAQPAFVLLQSVPMFTLAPVMVFWFGWSYTAIVIPTALMIFLPLTMSIYQGLKETPKGLLDLFNLNQATSWQKFWKLQLPFAVPYIFSGFKVSAAAAGIGAIAGEWAGGQNGLGVLMLSSRRETDLQTTFAALLCLALMTLCFYVLVHFAERRCTRYQPMTLFVTVLISSLVLITSFLAIPTKQPSVQQMRLLLDWFPNANHIPIYAGLKKGIFEKRGIHLEVLQLSDPSDSVPFVLSGKTDLALFYLPDVIRLKREHKDLHIAARLFEKSLNSFIYPLNKTIKEPKDLNGKIIGYCVAGSSIDALKKLCHSNGIIPKQYQDVSFDLVGTLGTGKVDAIYGAFWNIETEHLKSLGIETGFFNVTELGHPSYSELVFITKGDFDQFKEFRKALQESIDFCKTCPEEAFRLYSDCHECKSLETIAWEKNAWGKTIPALSTSQDISQKELDALQDWYWYFNLFEINYLMRFLQYFRLFILSFVLNSILAEETKLTSVLWKDLFLTFIACPM